MCCVVDVSELQRCDKMMTTMDRDDDDADENDGVADSELSDR